MFKQLTIVLIVGIFTNWFFTTSIHAVLVINEIFPNPEGDAKEWVEIYNPGNDLVNLNNWQLSDSKDHKKSLSELGEIGSKGFKVYETSEGWLNNDDGDTVKLINPDNQQIDGYSYGDSGETGIVWGRYPDGDPKWDRLKEPTKGAVNSTGFPTPTPQPSATPSPNNTPTTSPTPSLSPTPTTTNTPTTAKSPTPTKVKTPTKSQPTTTTLLDLNKQEGELGEIRIPSTSPDSANGSPSDDSDLAMLRDKVMGESTYASGELTSPAATSSASSKPTLDWLAITLIGGGIIFLTVAATFIIRSFFKSHEVE